MSYIIVVLIAVNLLHQIVAELRYGATRFTELHDGKKYVLSREVYPLGQVQPVLLREELLVVDYLSQRLKAGEHIVATVRNLHSERFKLVFAEFQRRHQEVWALHLNQREDSELDRYGLRKAIDRHAHYFPYLILEGYSQQSQLTLIKSVFEGANVSLLFRSLPEGFIRHGIAQYAEIIELPESYFMSLLYKNYPVSMIELCAKYAPINYNFFIRTQDQPLSELCCGSLPSTPVTQCVREFMHNDTHLVELSRLRGCLEKGTNQGLFIQNGMARVRKEYYWAGRCDITQFTHHTNPNPASDVL